jgi:SAM-dependent methyltransferase
MSDWVLDSTCALWRCPGCHHVQRDLTLAPARARAAEYGGDPSADRIRLELTERRLRRRVPTATSGRVLEIGSANGQLARRLAGTAAEVVAVDLHAPDVAAGGPPVRYLVGLLEEVDLAPGSFDLVVGIHVLEHVADLRATLARVHHLLRPGGTGYFVTPNAECTALSRFGGDWWMLEDPTHVRFISARSAGLIARSCGFGHCETRALITDSLGCDGASLARHLAAEIPPGGILQRRSAAALAAGAIPAALVVRTARPSWRPTLEIVLRRPEGR